MMPMEGASVCEECGMMPGGMDEADMDEMKLGVAGRGEGIPDRRRDDDVHEPEELGAHLDTRSSIDVPKSGTRLKADRRKTGTGMDQANMVEDDDQDQDDQDEQADAMIDEVTPPGDKKTLKQRPTVRNPKGE